MLSKNVASAICKMFEFVEQIASEFERAGFSIEKSFHKRWWVKDYSIFIKCEDKYVLFLGIWPGFWRDHGYPLCVGVDATWEPAIIERFKEMFPGYIIWPNNGTFRCFIKGVDQHLLTGDAVRDVANWLLQGYLNGIGDVLTENQYSTKLLNGTV
jgi:hypothetical protein